MDFRIEVGGVVVAEEKGALVTGTSLKNSALCVGAILHGTRSPGSSVTVFLDDP